MSLSEWLMAHGSQEVFLHYAQALPKTQRAAEAARCGLAGVPESVALIPIAVAAVVPVFVVIPAMPLVAGFVPVAVGTVPVMLVVIGPFVRSTDVERIRMGDWRLRDV